MKQFLLFICLYFVLGSCVAQSRKTPTLAVILFKSKVYTYFKDGRTDDFGTANKIAFFKDCTIYETSILHHNSGTNIIYKNSSADTVKSDNLPVLTKITHEYYVIQKGSKTGLYYKTTTGQGVPFILDSLIKKSNLDRGNEDAGTVDLIKPKEVLYSKTGKVTKEKFLFLSEDFRTTDTLYRYYDEKMKDVDFSISKTLDANKKTKLRKSVYIKVFKDGIFDKIEPFKSEMVDRKLQPLKLEMLNEISIITKTCTKKELDMFQALFDKFEAEWKAN